MKIRTRFGLLMIFLSLLLATAFIKSENVLLRGQLISAQEEWTATLVQAVAESVTRDVIDGERLHTQDLLSQIVSQESALEYMYVTDFEKHLFAHTFEDGFPLSLVARSQITEHEQAMTYSTELGELAEYDTPLIDGMDAYLHIGVNQKKINDIVEKALAGILPLVLASVVVSLLLAFYAANRDRKSVV